MISFSICAPVHGMTYYNVNDIHHLKEPYFFIWVILPCGVISAEIVEKQKDKKP